MAANIDHTILFTSIDELPLSDSLKEIMHANQIATLGEATVLSVSDLMSLPGFNMHALTEFVTFLEKNQLAGLLKHAP